MHDNFGLIDDQRQMNNGSFNQKKVNSSKTRKSVTMTNDLQKFLSVLSNPSRMHFQPVKLLQFKLLKLKNLDISKKVQRYPVLLKCTNNIFPKEIMQCKFHCFDAKFFFLN